jgi:hypothetical protein
MIVPDPRTGFPLVGNLIHSKIPPVYGPGVPEFQETIQTRPRTAPTGDTFDWIVEFSVLSIDNSGPTPFLVWSAPEELYRIYIRDGLAYNVDPDPDDAPAPAVYISLTTAV